MFVLVAFQYFIKRIIADVLSHHYFRYLRIAVSGFIFVHILPAGVCLLLAAGPDDDDQLNTINHP